MYNKFLVGHSSNYVSCFRGLSVLLNEWHRGSFGHDLKKLILILKMGNVEKAEKEVSKPNFETKVPHKQHKTTQ